MAFDSSQPEPASTRRGMLLGAGLVGLAGTLSGCGGSKDGSPGASPGGGQPGHGGSLGKASDIPIGSGKIFKSEKIVVTQPKAGEFRAFTAVCTHFGCTVGSISGGKIHCPCHGSAYNLADGSVANGPADKPLAAKAITVRNGELELG